jgi:hypothetical protein
MWQRQSQHKKRKGPGQDRREVIRINIERGFKSRWSNLW